MGDSFDLEDFVPSAHFQPLEDDAAVMPPKGDCALQWLFFQIFIVTPS